MMIHMIPVMEIHGQLIRKLTVIAIHCCWIVLWCIVTYAYFSFATWINTKLDYFIFIYLLSTVVVLLIIRGEELFKPVDLKVFLRLAIHTILTVFYWPFAFYMEVSCLFSCPIYIVLSILEFVADNCVMLDDNFINQQNDNGMFLVHVIFVYLLIWTWLKFQINLSNQCLYGLLHYILHLNVLPHIYKLLVDQIQDFINWYQHQHRFFKRYSYCKRIIYFIIQCIRLCCLFGSPFLLIYLHFKVMSIFHNENGLQIINVTNLDENTTERTRYTSEIIDTYYHDRYTAKRFTLYESIQTGRTILQEKIFDKECEELKYFPGEYVELEFYYMKNHTDKTFYFWTHNGKVVETDTNGKYSIWNDTYSDDFTLRYYLRISDLGKGEFGKYTLVEQSPLSLADLYLYFYNIPFRSNILKNIERGVFVLKKVKSFCIVYEQPTLVTVFSDLGHRVVLSNFRFHMLYNDYEPRYTVDDEKDIKSVCTVDSCYPTIANRMKILQPYQQSISNGLVNISFCACPEAYSRKYHTLQFVNKYSKHIAKSPVKIDLKPTMNVLFNYALFTEFIDCQISGYIYFKDFFLCLQRSNEKWKKFQAEITKTFIIQWYIEDVSNFVAFALPVLFMLFIDICLKKLLFVIFHPDLYIRHGREFQPDDMEFDVYISFCDESVNDTILAIETIARFVREVLGYSTRCTNDVPPGAHRRKTFEHFIARSKAMVIIMSNDYLDNDACIQEYDYTLLPLLGVSRLNKDNILLLKTGTCPVYAAPLALFTVLDWSDTVTNIRTEEKKQQELKRWLEKRFKQPWFSKFSDGYRMVYRLVCQFFDKQ